MRDPGFSLSRAAFAGAVGAVALAFIAAADYHYSNDEYLELLNRPDCPPESAPPAVIPSTAPAVSPSTAACQELGVDAFNRREQIEQDFQVRVVLYVIGFGLIAGSVSVSALRARPDERARIFNNLGVAGVCALVVAGILGFFSSSEGIGLGTAPWVLGPALVAAAAIGRVSAVTGADAGDAAKQVWRSWQVWPALGLTALVVLGALLYVPTQPPCWDSESVGDPEALYWLAVAGVGAGLFSLATRHWFSALLAIVANPIAFVMIAGASCAFI